MSKLTDNLDLADFGNTPQRAAKTLEAATEIGAKNELTAQEIDILIEADYYNKNGKFKSSSEIIQNRLDEIFSVMGFVAESSLRWKSIMEDETAKQDFINTYRKGVAGLIQREWFGKK
ncbi:hypothetical protein C9D20_22310 [Salmonella enterica subsp. enterica serovar Infantis]|nr:hypothetical protein [Salmonella enterica subsp. enterica serovar Infantis]